MTPVLHPDGRPRATLPDAEARLRFIEQAAPQALNQPAGTPVQRIDTHMSWVFLLGERVLKLKRPVRHDFLDFSTPLRRQQACRDELRLNRRLAPDVYLGLMALRWRHGALALVPEGAAVGPGRTLDWLVLMRRLDAARMLDRRIADGTLAAAEVDALATRLTTFYRSVPARPLGPQAYVERQRAALVQNRAVLLHPRIGLPEAAPVLDGLQAALDRHAELLAARARAGRIVDGHGDLRPEHVALGDPPVVIDALEFNPALREVDPFDELCFLGLECRMAGAEWVGPRLLQRCATGLGDAPPAALLALYTASRAMLRARLSLAHLLDAQPRTPARWAPQAARYVSCCARALAELTVLAAS